MQTVWTSINAPASGSPARTPGCSRRTFYASALSHVARLSATQQPSRAATLSPPLTCCTGPEQRYEAKRPTPQGLADGHKKLKRDWTLCAYCAAPATTSDHAPPRGIFGDLLKTDHSVQLVTVPSCAHCNLSQSKDDTYFRDAMFVATAMTVDGFPDAVRDSVRRSLESAGGEFRPPIQTFMRDARERWGVVGDSSVLRSVQAVPIRWDRIKRTVGRTARGLYWRHRGARVPNEFDVTIVGDKERDVFGFHQLDVFRDTAQASLGGTRHIVHREVFMYSIAFASDDPRMAVLTLCFYRKMIFLAVIGPPEVPTVLTLA